MKSPGLSDLKTLPLSFDPNHEFLEARLAAELGENGSYSLR